MDSNDKIGLSACVVLLLLFACSVVGYEFGERDERCRLQEEAYKRGYMEIVVDTEGRNVYKWATKTEQR